MSQNVHRSARRSLAAHARQMDRLDLRIMICVIVLNVFGCVMVYSASAYSCAMNELYHYDHAYFLKRQIIFVLMGAVAMLVVRLMNYRKWIKLSYWVFGGSLGSLFLLYTPLAVTSHGASRWINLGFFQLQVAEVVKVGVILAAACFLHRHAQSVNSIRKLAIYLWLFMGVIPAGMVYVISDNLSSAVIIVGIVFLMTFVITKMTKTHVVCLLIAVVAAFGLYQHYSSNLPTQEDLNKMPFREGRMYAWVAPENYADDQGFQPLQGMYAVASGGLFGKGLGNSVQKLEKIPEAQNDMIFAIICEELGMVGAAVMLAMFAYLVYHILRVAATSETLYGKGICLGVAFHIALQVLANVGVVLGILPNTGVSLPFISYGGSAILFTMLEIGMVLSVDRQHTKAHLKRKRRQLEREMQQ